MGMGGSNSGKSCGVCFLASLGSVQKTFVVYVSVLSGDVSVKAGFCQKAGKMGMDFVWND